MVFLCLVFHMDDIYRPETVYESVPSFGDLFSICLFHNFLYIKRRYLNYFVYPHFLIYLYLFNHSQFLGTHFYCMNSIQVSLLQRPCSATLQGVPGEKFSILGGHSIGHS
jgi:hypothetical protein